MFERFRAGTADKSPLTIAGDGRGVLCLHGITGTPFEVRPLAEHFGRARLFGRRPCWPATGNAGRPGVDELARLVPVGRRGARATWKRGRAEPHRHLWLFDGGPAGVAAGAPLPGAHLGAGLDVDAPAAPTAGGARDPDGGAPADRLSGAPAGRGPQARGLGRLGSGDPVHQPGAARLSDRRAGGAARPHGRGAPRAAARSGRPRWWRTGGRTTRCRWRIHWS